MGVGVEEFGIGVGAFPSCPTLKEHEEAYSLLYTMAEYIARCKEKQLAILHKKVHHCSLICNPKQVGEKQIRVNEGSVLTP